MLLLSLNQNFRSLKATKIQYASNFRIRTLEFAKWNLENSYYHFRGLIFKFKSKCIIILRMGNFFRNDDVGRPNENHTIL